MVERFCPQCGAPRIAEFRFCRGCGLDFDELTSAAEPLGDAPTIVHAVEAPPVTPNPPPAARRPYGRYAVIGVVVLLGLGAIGSLSNREGAADLAPLSTAKLGATITLTATEPTPITATSTRAFAPTGRTTKAKVTRIIDGDTIVVAIGSKSYHVRYIGMDTPEEVKPNTPIQAMAREATAANTRLVAGKTVLLERDVSETDRFGRLLRNVWVQRNGVLTLVGLELVRTGFAQVTTFPPDVKYVDQLTAAETEARSAEIGLWGQAPAATPAPQGFVGGGGSKCHPSYAPCLPVVDDLDCADVRAIGKAPVRVKGPDDYRLDGDHDGVGCE
jgi:micrococcal nuclease